MKNIRRELSQYHVFVWMIGIIRRFLFRHTKQYKNYINSNISRRVVYLSDIDHGNLGDHAILYAMHSMLKGEGIETEDNTYAFGRKYCLSSLDIIAKATRQDDIIILPGGGWIGTLWRESGNLFTLCLELFKDNRIISFPQTITFENTVYGKEQKERFLRAFSVCKNLYLMVRDRQSYDFMMSNLESEEEKNKIGLYPDIVLSLDEKSTVSRENVALFVTRQDRERTVSKEAIDKIIGLLSAKNFVIEKTDTVLPNHIGPQEREIHLKKKWEQFAKSRIVVTDRLHGMIFSIITNTPCIVFDNSNHKIKNTYELWLSKMPHVRYIEMIDDLDLIGRAIDELLVNTAIYSNEPLLNECFEELRERVRL